MNYGVGVPSGHAIGEYVKELIPKGKTVFNVPIAEDATADHIAKKVAPQFAKAGKDISLGMEDGIYKSDSPRDKELRANLYDKYFLAPSLTDPFMTLYNKVADRLLKEHPESKSKIGFLAYSQHHPAAAARRSSPRSRWSRTWRRSTSTRSTAWTTRKSPPRQEYREMMYRWAKVMQGRVVIYDYDQGMLVWRDIPEPVDPGDPPGRQALPQGRHALLLVAVLAVWVLSPWIFELWLGRDSMPETGRSSLVLSTPSSAAAARLAARSFSAWEK